MIEALKKVEVLTKGCVDKILDKLANGRGDDGLARLVEALNKAEVLKEERVTKILPEFIPDDISIVENMKLVINLKRNNIDVKLLKLLVPFWDDSLSGNELFKKTDIDKIEEKNIITQVIIKYLENRLKNLQLNGLNDEKEFWKDAVSELKGEGIISDEKESEFQNKLNDVYNINNFVSVLQWLGCLLFLPITLGLALWSDKVRNRISSPTKRRVFKHFK